MNDVNKNKGLNELIVDWKMSPKISGPNTDTFYSKIYG